MNADVNGNGFKSNGVALSANNNQLFCDVFNNMDGEIAIV